MWGHHKLLELLGPQRLREIKGVVNAAEVFKGFRGSVSREEITSGVCKLMNNKRRSYGSSSFLRN